MENPARIVDDGNEWAREIVRSARTDVPSEQFRRRLARQLGLASGAVGLSAVGSAKAVATGVWLKWMVVGGAAGVLTIGVARAIVSPGEVKPAASTAARSLTSAQAFPARARSGLDARSVAAEARAPSLVSPAIVSSAPEKLSELRADGSSAANTKGGNIRLPPSKRNRSDSSTPRASTASTSEASATPSASSAGSTTLVEELALINSVRAALAKNAASAALRSLDEYAAKYPNGRLRTEALVLRVAALAEVGERASAKVLADEFLATHPDSPYAQRLRSLSNSGAEREPLGAQP